MKKLTLISLLSVIISAGGLWLRYHERMIQARDAAFRGRLPGVWLRTEDGLPSGVGMPLGMRCTNTVAADGSFVERSWFSHPDRTNTYRRTGTWLVKSGYLLETVKTSSNPCEVTPHADAGWIDSVKTDEFVLSWSGITNTQIWRKISP